MATVLEPDRRPRGFTAGVLLAALLFAAPLPGSEAVSPRRVVAIGDVHGAYDSLVAILRQTGVVDERARWAGRETILVQTGDMIDRGARSFEVVDLLMRLEREAPEKGGRAVALLGNHELLNLLGDLRDVTPEILAGFADERSELRRKLMLGKLAAVVERRSEVLGSGPHKLDPAGELNFLAQHPLGLIEYVEALGPSGRYGRWLRSLPAAVRIDGVLYVHGGLSPELAQLELEEIDQGVHAELTAIDRARAWLLEAGLILPTATVREMVSLLRQLEERPEIGEGDASLVPPAEVRALVGIDSWLIARSDGPFWFRGYASWDDDEGRRLLPEVLAASGSRHIVVGHTPQASQSIQSRFDAGVFLIDTGMLASVYRGRPAALEVEAGRFTAVYLGQRQVLVDPALADPMPGATAAPPAAH